VRVFILAVTVAVAAILTSGLSIAQNPLPPPSPSEQQIEQNNRAIVDEERQLSQQQQSQVESNQLRESLQHSQDFPSMIGPGTGPTFRR
jgi:hypothetical protein